MFIYLVFMSLFAPKLQTVLYNRLLLWITRLHKRKFSCSKTTAECQQNYLRLWNIKKKKEIIPPSVKLDLSTRGKKDTAQDPFVKVPALLGMLNCLCRVVGWLWKHLPAITLNGWGEFCYFSSAHSSVSLFMAGFKANDRLFPPFLLRAGISLRRDFFL